MSTARELLREVKRRLGDTTTPYPDETDSLAFLNKAVQGIYNYGVYLRSERLKKIIECTATGGSYTCMDGIAFVESVISKEKMRQLMPLTSPAQLLHVGCTVNPGIRYFRVSEDTINLFPTPEANAEDELVLSYFPRVIPLYERKDNLPFSPELDSVIEAWTIGLITKQGAGFSDIEFATQMNLGNTLSRYFRGQFKHLVTGRGPW